MKKAEHITVDMTTPAVLKCRQQLATKFQELSKGQPHIRIKDVSKLLQPKLDTQTQLGKGIAAKLVQHAKPHMDGQLLEEDLFVRCLLPLVAKDESQSVDLAFEIFSDTASGTITLESLQQTLTSNLRDCRLIHAPSSQLLLAAILSNIRATVDLKDEDEIDFQEFKQYCMLGQLFGEGFSLRVRGVECETPPSNNKIVYHRTRTSSFRERHLSSGISQAQRRNSRHGDMHGGGQKSQQQAKVKKKAKAMHAMQKVLQRLPCTACCKSTDDVILYVWLAAIITAALGCWVWLFVKARPYERTSTWYWWVLPVGKGSAQAIKVLAGTILIPMMKNTLTALKYRFLHSAVPYQGHLFLHVFSAFSILLMAVLHAISHHASGILVSSGIAAREDYQEVYRINVYHIDQVEELTLWDTAEFITGYIMLAIFFIVYLFASPWPRKAQWLVNTKVGRVLNQTKNFLRTHLLVFAFYAILFIHFNPRGVKSIVTDFFYGQRDVWAWVVLPLALYLLDKLYGIYHSRAKPVTLLGAQSLPGKAVALYFTKPVGCWYECGMSVKIAVKKWSILRFRPFTIASAPGDDFMRLIIKSSGKGQTEKLFKLIQDLAKTGLPGNPSNEGQIPPFSLQGGTTGMALGLQRDSIMSKGLARMSLVSLALSQDSFCTEVSDSDRQQRSQLERLSQPSYMQPQGVAGSGQQRFSLQRTSLPSPIPHAPIQLSRTSQPIRRPLVPPEASIAGVGVVFDGSGLNQAEVTQPISKEGEGREDTIEKRGSHSAAESSDGLDIEVTVDNGNDRAGSVDPIIPLSNANSSQVLVKNADSQHTAPDERDVGVDEEQPASDDTRAVAAVAVDCSGGLMDTIIHENPAELYEGFGKLAAEAERQLQRQLDQDGGEGGSSLNLWLEGPFYAPAAAQKHFDVKVLVAGGVGVTPSVSVVRNFLHSLTSEHPQHALHQKLYFIWVVSDPQHTQWVRSDLEACWALDTDGHVDIQIYVTPLNGDNDVRSSLLKIAQIEIHKQHQYDFITGIRCRTPSHFGRPDMDKILKNVALDCLGHYEKVGVFCCGPKALGATVQTACDRYTKLSPLTFEYYQEVFY